jgi:hypothetical protein
MTDGKLELKCRRCQRVGLVDVGKPLAEGEVLEVQWLAGPARTKSK